MKKKYKSLIAIVIAISMLPMATFAQEINMDQEMVADPSGKIKAEFEVDAEYTNEMGYDLIVSFPLNISLTYNSDEEAFTGTDEVYVYGLTEADTMVQVMINKQHSEYGTLVGPSMETYNISEDVIETLEGKEKATVSAEVCYENLLAVKEMEGKTTEDISAMELKVAVPTDSFIPKYKGNYYTCVPLTISIEDVIATRTSGLYGSDGIAFLSWEDLTKNVGTYENSYADISFDNFSVFQVEDNGNGYTLTSNYADIYRYKVDGEEIKTLTPDDTYLIEGQYSVNSYNFSGAYLNDCHDYINGELVLPEGIIVLGKNAFKCITNFSSIILPNSLTTIKSYALGSLWNAITVTMHTNVTTIEDYAFDSCNGLTDIYYTGTEEQWDAISIGNVGNDILSTVTIHYNYTGNEE